MTVLLGDGKGGVSTSGEIERIFGSRLAQHLRLGLVESETILLYHAHPLRESIERFLLNKAGAERVEAMGDYRRRVEIISRFDFLVQARDFDQVVETMKRYGGRTAMIEATGTTATYSLSSGPLLCLELARKKNWGLSLIRGTGSAAHLRKLASVAGRLTDFEDADTFPSEENFYKGFGMQFIPPELREGLDEVSRSRQRTLPQLITEDDIRGDLHTHTFASDGADSVEEMAQAAQKLGYEYIGVTDHSPSLKIANGQSVYYVRGGAGPAVVLIHGFPQDWYEFHAIMPELAKRFTVIAIDLPGIGRSGPVPGGHDAATMAKGLHALVQEFGLKDPYIVGHDLGGMVTYAYARLFTADLRGAMILDVPLPGIEGWNQIEGDPSVWHIRFMQVPALAEKLVTGRSADFLEYFFQFADFTPREKEHYVSAYSSAAQLQTAAELRYRHVEAIQRVNRAAEHTAYLR